MSFKHIVILLISTGMVMGCGSIAKNTENRLATPSQHRSYRHAIPQDIIKEDTDTIKDRLYSRYQEWRGVRYRLGGASRSGIDCSAFVKIIYETEFGLTLPRTALSQAELGDEINQEELEAGDLVFFKTGRHSWHVGIYLEKRKFLHVSSKKGVTLSRLDNIYWRSKYWKSVRI
ncbi:MAG: NlpC/P60 family protein [Nitrosomonas halophila]|jgi:cell wall-associated NlpC family hydrolase